MKNTKWEGLYKYVTDQSLFQIDFTFDATTNFNLLLQNCVKELIFSDLSLK